MELRDWLIVLGVLVLVVVAADAVRRVRGRNRLRLKIDNKFKDLPDYANDDVGEVRVVRADGKAPEPREPSFNDADLIGDVGATDTRREPALREPAPRRNDDFDLLMDGDFQGVGEGAGDYLGKPRVVSQPEPDAAESAENVLGNDQPEGGADTAAAVGERAIDEASSSAVTATAASATLTPESALPERDDAAAADEQPPESPAGGPVEAPGRADAEPETEVAATDAASESHGETVIESMINSMIKDEEAQSAKSDRSNADEPEQEKAAATAERELEGSAPSSAAPPEPATEVAAAASTAEPVAAETAPPAMTVVDAAAEPLDLTRPVPEILAEQARKAASEAASEPAAEPRTAAAADPLVAGETDGLAPVKATLGAEPDDNAVGDVLGAADGRDEPSADEVAGAVGDEARSASTEKGKSKSDAGTSMDKKGRREPRPEVQTTFFEHYPDLAPEPSASKSRKSGATRTAKPAKPKEPQPAPDEVLVITVMARHDPFSGRALFKLVEACGLTFGRMSIFHRHEQDNGEGPVQFSMVNAVHPGTFQPDEASDFTTPGVTFFLTMSEPSKLMEAFDCMLATAQCVADNLAGELRDEHRSSLRSQTIEHYRQKVRDFERRRLARRA